MADEFQSSGNWWDSSSRNNRFEAGTPPSSSSLNSLGSFGWSPDNIKCRPSMDSVSDCADPNLHFMGLGLSSQPMDWPDQAPSLFTSRGEKATETSFRSILQENINSNPNFEQETSTGQLQWREKLFLGDSSTNVRGFSLDQTQFSPQYSSGESTVTSQGLPSCTNFQMESQALYGSTSSLLQGLFATHHLNNNPQQSCSSTSMNFSYPQNYGVNNSSNQIVPPSNWSNKVPQFLTTNTSPPKQQAPNYSHLHFSNNAPFWNASSESSTVKDVRPTFFPSHLQPQFAAQPFDEKPKNISEVVRESGSVVKKIVSESASKRPRNDSSPSPLPAFKVRKEKMGDRITALQQLVSPFGKTDTASVLSEAIQYIKFLHEQVTVLSNPYMKSGAAMQHQQNSDKSKEPEGPKQDLRSRGLCLVPISSTIPVTHETTVDFWTPTFGGSFR